jgi:hypothetical protein
MNKKVLKVLAVVLILLGLVIATSNFVDTELHSEPGKWRNYIEYPPDCEGGGTECYDMTGTNPN